MKISRTIEPDKSLVPAVSVSHAPCAIPEGKIMSHDSLSLEGQPKELLEMIVRHLHNDVSSLLRVSCGWYHFVHEVRKTRPTSEYENVSRRPPHEQEARLRVHINGPREDNALTWSLVIEQMLPKPMLWNPWYRPKGRHQRKLQKLHEEQREKLHKELHPVEKEVQDVVTQYRREMKDRGVASASANRLDNDVSLDTNFPESKLTVTVGGRNLIGEGRLINQDSWREASLRIAHALLQHGPIAVRHRVKERDPNTDRTLIRKEAVAYFHYAPPGVSTRNSGLLC